MHWCWEILKANGEEEAAEDEWLDSITDSMDMNLSKLWGWWQAGEPGMLQSLQSQRVRHDIATEQQSMRRTRNKGKWTGGTGHGGREDILRTAMVGQGKQRMHLISRKGLDKTEKAFRSPHLAEEKNCAWQRSLQRIFKMFHCTSRLFSALWHFSRDRLKIWIAFICVFLPGCYFSHVIFCRPRWSQDFIIFIQATYL